MIFLIALIKSDLLRQFIFFNFIFPNRDGIFTGSVVKNSSSSIFNFLL